MGNALAAREHRSPATARQLEFDDLDLGPGGRDVDLADVEFVVVDLETTGTRPGDDRITEIGAVKVRGGQVLGEFATLVDPGRSIPPQIVHLTGITEAMIVDAPTIEQVLPAFLEFAAGAVLVAHNARFDTAFLRAACAAQDRDWTFGPALCTVTLARRVLGRDEAPRVALSHLAQLFGTATTPTHRALDDARTTVEVMHRLFERVGNCGVRTLGDLRSYLPGVTRAQRAKRTLADGLPECPGVYMFRGPSEEVLYVGTAVNLRRRVRSYFTGGETRARMAEMVALATRVDHVECAHALEAGVRELRLLAAHAPPYNRRSKYPRKGWWVRLGDEPFPRLIVGRTPSPLSVGPISSRADAAAVADILTEACRLRSCTARLRSNSIHRCELGEDGRRTAGGCHAATAIGEDAQTYRRRAETAAAVLAGTDSTALEAMFGRLERLVEQEMFETAARMRDRLALTVEALERCQRLSGFCRLSELVAARPDGHGGWQLAVVRHGRLAAAGVAERGVPPVPLVEALSAAAETVVPGDGPLRGAWAEEAALVHRWVTEPGTRLVCASSGFSVAARGAGTWSQWGHRARSARQAATVAYRG